MINKVNDQVATALAYAFTQTNGLNTRNNSESCESGVINGEKALVMIAKEADTQRQGGIMDIAGSGASFGKTDSPIPGLGENIDILA